MRRREFITLLGGAAFTHALPSAAQPKRLPVVAFVSPSVPLAEIVGADPVYPPARAFVHGLRDLGWIDGRNVIIERRSAEDDPQRAPAIYAELLARGVDVIMPGGSRWMQGAALLATRNIPIIAVFTEDPVAADLIKSLARPGGNLTGVTVAVGPDIQSKRLQLLAEFAPGITRVAFLAPPEVLALLGRIARPAGVTIVPVQVEFVGQYDGAFATILRERADALLAIGSIHYVYFQRITAFASESRLPAIYGIREAVEAGGLMCYGASVPGAFRQSARLVDRILKGARPEDLPTEQPTAFELVINAKTAQALGLTMPLSIIAQADEVIE